MVTRAAVLALALALAAPAAADDDAAVAAHLRAASAHRAGLRYDAALAEVDRALAGGRASPAQVAALFRLAGELTAGLDRPTVAAAWFARWLALTPDGRLPDDASPKLADALAAARAGGVAALALSVERGADTLTVTVVDRLGLARAIRVTTAPDRPGVDGARGAALPWPRTRPAVVIALDEHGNQLVVRVVPAAPTPGARVALVRRWQPYAGAAAALAALGGVFAWRTAVAQDDFDALRAASGAHTFAELEAVRARGERAALVANLAFGAAGVAAVTAGIMAWQRPRATTLTLAPTGDGAAVTVTRRF